MPISQNRMLALIAIIDEGLASRETLHTTARMELDEATTEFYATDPDARCDLAANMLSHLQSVASTILDNPRGLSTTSLETLTREREHFRLTHRKNSTAARSMARRRSKLKETTSHIEEPAR